MDDVIRLDAVRKVYRSSHLGRETETVGVERLSLEIRRGEVYGLLGLNGAGKTTTIKMILGLHYPTEGVVRVLDREMPDLGVMGRIGYLPEAAYLNPYLTGRETVRLFATLSGMPHARAMERAEAVLAEVGMRPAADKPVASYSKGMRQRISMAQALVHEPDILVFDEPITGLDPLAIRQMRGLVEWLKDQGKTVFFSSHSISEVERLCDRIGILAGGKLEAEIASAEWKAQPEGWLEDRFASTVTLSDKVDPIRFGGVER